jgi:hypothetical protein
VSGVDDLIAFLRARLDEDERVALDGERYWHGIRVESATEAEENHVRRWDPARVLAEVEAKRRILDDIVGEATGLDMSVDMDRRIGARDEATEPYLGDQLLRLLGLPYADHPDYREEWRP